MKSYEMMEKIGATLKDGESIIVSIAHRGNWNGANRYTITNKSVEYLDHKWHWHGTLLATYSERVLHKAWM